MAFKETPVIELDSQTETKRPVGNHLIPPPTAPEEGAKTGKPAKGQEGIPAWLEHLYETPPIKARLVPTHELLRMANAIGIDVDYSTLRFWQKRGLVPKPVRGPVDNGRGTRGYYDGSLIDRLGFIREIQKTYSMGLEEIRTELERIDQQVTKTPGISLHRPYQERLAVLQSQREVESRRTLLSVLSKALGLDPDDIATIVIRKKDGQTIRFLVNKVSEPEK